MSAKTFRISQIPAGVTESSLPQFLHQAEERLGEASNIHIRSLAPAPEYWGTFPVSRRQTATVEFDVLPEFLQDEKKSIWILPIRGQKDSLVIDTAFLGLTPLNDVQALDYQYDCIAISGLASHPFGSWRQRESSAARQFMWLRDQLPQDVPGLRVLTYGYDSRLTGSESFQSIDNIAQTFIQVLKACGWGEYASKPIILLAHSLGGIVSKRALYYLAGLRDDMLKKFRMIIFFGVPNKGMHIDHLLSIVKGKPNEDLIKNLSQNSPYLQELDNLFSGAMLYCNTRLVSAIETQKSPTVMITANGDVKRSGNSETLVNEDSAIQSGSKTPDDILAINQNHSNMVKFSPSDPDYLRVKVFINGVVKLRERANEHINPSGPMAQSSSHSIQLKPQDDINSRHLINYSLQSHATDRSQASQVGNIEDSIKQMIDSLKFDEQYARVSAIRPPEYSTFDWILHKKELGFIDWLQSDKRFYWIQGKPGSGKSTLMRYLHDNVNLKDIFVTSGLTIPRLDLWFFFNERGTSLQKSLNGLFRTILYHMASRDRRLAELIHSVYTTKLDEENPVWTIDEMSQAFSSILEQSEFDIELVLFLDALDEYDGVPEVLCRWLLDLAAQNTKQNRRTKVKICFSSRPWAAFVETFHLEPGFAMQDHTITDIRHYISSRLSSEIADNTGSGAWLHYNISVAIDLITMRADGVFLWVKLALNEILLPPLPQTREDLQTLMEKLPQELEEFYVRTINRIPQYNKFRVYVMLELIRCSGGIVSPQRLYHAASCAQGRTFQECCDLLDSAEKTKNSIEELEHKIHVCGGLLEIKLFDLDMDVDYELDRGENPFRSHSLRKYVQFTHKTVLDFVGSPEFVRILLGTHSELNLENGYSFWMKYYLLDSFPLLGPRFVEFVHLHAVTTGRAPKTLIESIPFERMYPASRHNFFTSAFMLGVVADLRLYVQLRLAEYNGKSSLILSPSFNPVTAAVFLVYLNTVREKKPKTTNLAEMCKILIEHGWRIDDDRIFGLKPFEMIFAARGVSQVHFHFICATDQESRDIAQVLIQHGHQDPNARLRDFTIGGGYRTVPGDYEVKSPKLSAIHVARCTWLKMLLENGADPNLQDLAGNTALDIAFLAVRKYDLVRYFEVVPPDILSLIAYGGGVSKRGAKVLSDLLRRYEREERPPPRQLLNIAHLEGQATGPTKKMKQLFDGIKRAVQISRA